jgi:TPR repeat protein
MRRLLLIFSGLIALAPVANAKEEPPPLPFTAEEAKEMQSALQKGDLATEFKLVKSLADKGVARAQFNVGAMYAAGEGVRQDHVEAIKWFRLAADQGYARAELKLGAAYANGDGTGAGLRPSI